MNLWTQSGTGKMTEKDFYKKVRESLSNTLIQRIESPLTAQGIPDLVYHVGNTTGFIELKYLKDFPVKESTIVKFKFTDYQRMWLSRWKRRGANCWLLVGVGKDAFLFKKFDIANCLNTSEFIRQSYFTCQMKELHHLEDILKNGY